MRNENGYVYLPVRNDGKFKEINCASETRNKLIKRNLKINMEKLLRTESGKRGTNVKLKQREQTIKDTRKEKKCG